MQLVVSNSALIEGRLPVRASHELLVSLEDAGMFASSEHSSAVTTGHWASALVLNSSKLREMLQERWDTRATGVERVRRSHMDQVKYADRMPEQPDRLAYSAPLKRGLTSMDSRFSGILLRPEHLLYSLLADVNSPSTMLFSVLIDLGVVLEIDPDSLSGIKESRTSLLALAERLKPEL